MLVGSSRRWLHPDTFPRFLSGSCCDPSCARVRPNLLIGIETIQRPQCGRCMVSNRACKLENAREWEGSQVTRAVRSRGGCQQGGAVLHAARSAAALYGCAVCGGSRGIAGERLAPRQPPLHPHAHALPSPSSPCACWRLHRGNQPRAIGAQPAVGRCEPAQRAQRPSLSRRKAWQRWALRSESRCGAPRVPPWACWRTATALQRACVPRIQPHRTGPSAPSLGRVRSLIWLHRTHVCARAVL